MVEVVVVVVVVAVLQCGPFTFRGDPPYPVEWIVSSSCGGDGGGVVVVVVVMVVLQCGPFTFRGDPPPPSLPCRVDRE